MTGAWISGGIEWKFPNATHPPTCFSPVSHLLTENDDGSKTIWVGWTEWTFRMRYINGITIYPGRSVIEAKVHLINPTSLSHAYQTWANTAVPVNENYQTMYPTRIMTGHGKTKFWNWPVHEGKDLSWWKNNPNARSYFAMELGDFFGGYDHGQQAGTVITGNKYIVPGKKLFTWGTSPSGQLWAKILSDSGVPYIEPQIAAYSDNQPDYHWLEPGEVKSFSYFFFPVRDIGAYKSANVNGALNLEASGDSIKIGVYSTSLLNPGTIQLTQNSIKIFEKRLDIDPSKTFVHQLKIQNASDNLTTLTLSLLDEDGIVLLSYSPEFLSELPIPEPMKDYDDPGKIKTIDELWHAGDITSKFLNLKRGRTYFEEAVKRDPGDTRSGISLAELDLKLGKYKSALEHLAIAERRDPDNGKIFYLKAVAEEALENYELAYTHYYRSTYFEEYSSRGYEGISRLDIRSGEYRKANEHVEKAIEMNNRNQFLWVLKAISLRLKMDFSGAEIAVNQALKLDPLNPWAINELMLISKGEGKDHQEILDKLVNLLLGDPQNYIEVASYYAHAGLYADASDILEWYCDTHQENIAIPSYYIAYFNNKLQNVKQAEQWMEKGKKQAIDNEFPFRLEGLNVFGKALEYDKVDANAHYYLGMVYAGISEIDSALYHWETTVKYDPKNVRALRNLGLGYSQGKKEFDKAKEYYETAFKFAPNDSRILMELDMVNQALGESPSKRLAYLKKNRKIVEGRDELLTSMVDLMVQEGYFEEALDYLLNHHFRSWEGRYTIHLSYMEANIGLAKAAKTPEEAIKYYLKACEYPENLEVAPREPNLRGFLYYPMSRRYRQTGDQNEADRLLKITANESFVTPTIGSYYQALALRDLGQSTMAGKILDALAKEADQLINGGAEGYEGKTHSFSKALGYYYKSKIQEADGEMQKAQENYQKSVSIVPLVERRALTDAQDKYADTH